MFRSPKLFRSIILQSQTQICKCSNLPDKPSEKMPKDLTNLTDVANKEIAKLKFENDKSAQWKTPWHEKEGQYYSLLRGFYSEDSHTDLLKFLTSQINLRPSYLKNAYQERLKDKKRYLQNYIAERNDKLGDEIAAAYFLVHRDASIKFFGDERWVKKNELGMYELPTSHEADMYLQAIDCTDMELYYEGLSNLRNLRQVEWLSLNGCEELDDWALDRVSSIFAHSLLYLDLRNMPLISHRGLGALYKMDKLKILYVDNKFYSDEIEMVCLMLQDIKHDLDIRVTN